MFIKENGQSFGRKEGIPEAEGHQSCCGAPGYIKQLCSQYPPTVSNAHSSLPAVGGENRSYGSFLEGE